MVKHKIGDLVYYFDNAEYGFDALSRGGSFLMANATFVYDEKENKLMKCRVTIDDLVEGYYARKEEVSDSFKEIRESLARIREGLNAPLYEFAPGGKYYEEALEASKEKRRNLI